MSAPIPVAILGFSSAARTFHLPLLQATPAFAIHTVQQRSGGSSSASAPAGAALPGVRVVDGVADVFAGDDRLPAGGLVVVTTANATHFDFAMQAIAHGCHVVVEKPAVLTVREADELAAAAQKAGVVCTVFQNRRLDADFLTLRSLLAKPQAESPLGQLTRLESRFDRYRPYPKGGWREETAWQKGGGVLWDLGSHLVDQALLAFGPPESISAHVQATRRPESSVEDDFLLHLHYPATSIGGLRVTLGASCVSPFLDAEQPRFVAQGVKGSYLKRGLDPQENQLKAGVSPAASSFGSYSASEPASLRLGRLTTSAPAAPAKEGEAPNQPLLASADIPTLPGAYVRFYPAVAAAIRGEPLADSFVTLPQMQNNTRALLLCRKSADEGRSVKWTEDL